MTTYDRVFGSGPRGALISFALLGIACWLEAPLAFPQIMSSDMLRYGIFVTGSIICVAVILWSLKSLPPSERGRNLATHGAFKYFRHPLYAAFLSFFNFGFAVLLNNWIYIVWALTLLPIWHLNIQREELLMREAFGQDYDDYCQRTGRFFFKAGFLR